MTKWASGPRPLWPWTTWQADYSWEGATNTFEKKGGKIIQQQWMPMDTKDTAPYLTALKQADVFMPWYAGITHNVGIRQIREYGIKMPIILPQAGYMAHPQQIKEIGDYGVGFITSDAYVWTIDTPENRAFVEKYKKKYNMLPANVAYGGYFNMQILLQALRKDRRGFFPERIGQGIGPNAT